MTPGPPRTTRSLTTALLAAACITFPACAQTQPSSQTAPADQPKPAPFTARTWTNQRLDAASLDPTTAALALTPAGENPPAPRTLGWHEIHSIEGPTSDTTRDLLAMGRDIWRATTRLERGDSFGAEPLFEAAFERTRGTLGPTPAVVADGLLRCRLRRDARAAAIDAWLELAANLTAAPAREPNWGIDAPALDRRTRLVPALPPIWFDSLPARAFADALVDFDAAGARAGARAGSDENNADTPPPPGDPAGAIRTLYRAAARHALGDPIDPTETARAAAAASARDGGRLVAQVVLAQIGGPEDRAAARDALASELDNHEDRWRAVWASLAIGRSLLREPDPADQQRGILTLLAVHAADAEVSPYLTGIALADAALAAERMGDDRAARTIRNDLARQFPNHPVRQLPGLASTGP